MWWSFKPYESVAQRKAKAERKIKSLLKQGRTVSPVKPAGRKITTTFWGNSWCKHLESYSDLHNRLERGRSYIRNGSVIDLQIKPGLVTALVSGSEVYEIKIEPRPLQKDLWLAIKSKCSGQIGSLVDLLQGKLSSDVMNIVTARDGGLFPHPQEIRMKCSCPDYASLCKHLAAVLYGIGTRFDERPELFFQLRNVDHLELISAAGAGVAKIKSRAKSAIADDSLADIFGIEIAGSSSAPTDPVPGASPASAGKNPKATAKRSSRLPSKPGGRKSVGNKGSTSPTGRTAKSSKTTARAKAKRTSPAKRGTHSGNANRVR
jgi:uncharacterized Zn finger protein